MGPEIGPRPLRLGIVAGEASGDLLGAGLMQAFVALGVEAQFVGVGGPAMRSAGLDTLFDTERLAMNGFFEPLRRLPELLRLRRQLLGTFARSGVQGFVGIDFNGFNLVLERALKQRGVPVSHYVSPAVYAWRRGRLRGFHRAMDQVLTLYPFEPPLYRGTGVEAVFVGHPLADSLMPPPSRAAARVAIGIPVGASAVLALLPGSRPGEIARMGRDFLLAAVAWRAEHPDGQVVVAAVDAAARALLERLAAGVPAAASFTIVTARSREVLAAADLALVKSGTGTLEAMLLGKPMVVAYRMGPWTGRIVQRLLRSPFVALPNILAGEALVPELLQDAATPAAMAACLFEQPARAGILEQRFSDLSATLRQGASLRAARAVLALLARKGSIPAGGIERSVNEGS